MNNTIQSGVYSPTATLTVVTRIERPYINGPLMRIPHLNVTERIRSKYVPHVGKKEMAKES